MKRRPPHCTRKATQPIDRIGGAEGDRTLDLRIANAARKLTQAAKRARKNPCRIDLSRSVSFAASLEFWRF